jgi:glycosyltransferase involved in cell wall biosynthesis
MSLRIAVVTPLFPIREEPYRGIPIYNTVVQLQRLATVRVFCPFALYPQWKPLQPSSYVYRNVDDEFQPPLVPTEYISYPALPALSRPLNARNCGTRILPALRQFVPDLILAYWLYPEGRGALLAGRRLGVPVVGGARGSDLKRPPDRISRYLLRRTLMNMDGLLTVSEELRQRSISWGIEPTRVRTVLNGCDTTVFHAGDHLEARRRLALREDAEIILFVGHLVPWKGVPELVEAFIQLALRRPRLLLICAGEGFWSNQWSARLREHGLLDRVLLPGGCIPTQVAEWMTAASVVCLPSHSEGCPNVVIEALSCGRPVVATTVGAIPDLVDPRCGILVPPGLQHELAAALGEALDRQWPPALLTTAFSRSWEQVALETFEFCCEITERYRVGGRKS